MSKDEGCCEAERFFTNIVTCILTAEKNLQRREVFPTLLAAVMLRAEQEGRSRDEIVEAINLAPQGSMVKTCCMLLGFGDRPEQVIEPHRERAVGLGGAAPYAGGTADPSHQGPSQRLRRGH